MLLIRINNSSVVIAHGAYSLQGQPSTLCINIIFILRSPPITISWEARLAFLGPQSWRFVVAEEGGSLVRGGGRGDPPVGLAPSLNFASCNSRLRAPQPSTPPTNPSSVDTFCDSRGGLLRVVTRLHLDQGYLQDWVELLPRGSFS